MTDRTPEAALTPEPSNDKVANLLHLAVIGAMDEPEAVERIRAVLTPVAPEVPPDKRHPVASESVTANRVSRVSVRAAPEVPAAGLREALAAAERVKASAIANEGRLTPGAILDIQTTINLLAATRTPEPPDSGDGAAPFDAATVRETMRQVHARHDLAHDLGAWPPCLRSV